MKYKDQSIDLGGKSIEIIELSGSFLFHITQCALFVKTHINPLSILLHMPNDSSLCNNTCWSKVSIALLRSTNKKPVLYHCTNKVITS